LQSQIYFTLAVSLHLNFLFLLNIFFFYSGQIFGLFSAFNGYCLNLMSFLLNQTHIMVAHALYITIFFAFPSLLLFTV